MKLLIISALISVTLSMTSCNVCAHCERGIQLQTYCRKDNVELYNQAKQYCDDNGGFWVKDN